MQVDLQKPNNLPCFEKGKNHKNKSELGVISQQEGGNWITMMENANGSTAIVTLKP